MATLRRSIPLLQKGSRLLGARNFHISSHLEIRRLKSPRIKRAPVPPPLITMRIPKQSNSEDYLPPLALLSSAFKSGVMEGLEPDKAIDFLEAFVHNLMNSKAGVEHLPGLCTRHNVKPKHLVILSGILRRCPTTAQRTLAKKLAFSASEMGEETATYELIQSALNQGRVGEHQTTFHRLKRLAQDDPKNVDAQALLGKALFSQGDYAGARDWLTQATNGHLNFAGSGEALTCLGRAHLAENNAVLAETAFRRAALQLDEAPAYYHLAQLQEAGSEARNVYLLKAASSGVLEACHDLGMLELKKIKEAGKKPTSLEDYGMAREWLQIAANDGFGMSMLKMAFMCKAVGQDENALAWLEKAKAKEDVAAIAKGLAPQWAKTSKEEALELSLSPQRSRRQLYHTL